MVSVLSPRRTVRDTVYLFAERCVEPHDLETKCDRSTAGSSGADASIAQGGRPPAYRRWSPGRALSIMALVRPAIGDKFDAAV